MAILLNNGNGTFQKAVTYPSGAYEPHSVAVTDVDGDGNLDLVVGNLCTSGTTCTDSSVGVLLGNGNGTFQPAISYASGVSSYSVVVEDLNHDGKPDVLIANECFSDSNCDVGAAGVLINSSTYSTTTGLLSSANPITFGAVVTFTATVIKEFGPGAPTGTVTFFDGVTSLGGSSLNGGGVATFSTSTLSVGTRSITAAYNGDANFGTSTSPVLRQLVQGAVAQLSEPSLRFGNQTVGIPSAPQGVMLSNAGNTPLTVSITTPARTRVAIPKPTLAALRWHLTPIAQSQ